MALLAQHEGSNGELVPGVGRHRGALVGACLHVAIYALIREEASVGRGLVGRHVRINDPDVAQEHVVLERIVRRAGGVGPQGAAEIVALGASLDVRIILAVEVQVDQFAELVGRGGQGGRIGEEVGRGQRIAQGRVRRWVAGIMTDGAGLRVKLGIGAGGQGDGIRHREIALLHLFEIIQHRIRTAPEWGGPQLIIRLCPLGVSLKLDTASATGVACGELVHSS